MLPRSTDHVRSPGSTIFKRGGCPVKRFAPKQPGEVIALSELGEWLLSQLRPKVGIALQELGRGGEKTRTFTGNYGLCMVSAKMHTFISGMVVMNFHILVFSSACAIIDSADIYYFRNHFSRA